MSDATRPQTWEIVNENSLDVLETSGRESLDNLLDILNSKMNFPFRIYLTGTILNIQGSELQTYKSDGSEWGGLTESFKYSTAPIDGQYKKISESSLDISDGGNTGDFSAGVSLTCPNLITDQYVWLGLEAKSSGEISLVWGNPDLVLTSATYPTFTGTAICLIKLRASNASSSPDWGIFYPTISSDIIVFKGSGGGSGGAGSNDFVPVYKSSSEYRLQNTQGRSTRFNEQFFSIHEDLDFSYNLVDDKLWYVCIDANQLPGIIDSINKLNYIKEVDLDPNSPSFPQNLISLGYYEVVGGAVTQQNLGTYSSRAIDTFIGDLTVSYETTTSYRIQSSRGRLVRSNNKYFYLEDNNDLVKSFIPPTAGIWYVCLDTSGNGTEVTESHLIETQLDLKNIAFPQHYAPIASFEVITIGSSLGIDISSFRTVSDREISTTQGDFIPSYLDNDTFVINHTFGRKIKLLSSYFYSETNLISNFDKSASGTWYIVVDTADIVGSGQLTGSHIKFTAENPESPSFNLDFVAIGEYFVEADLTTVLFDKFIPYSVAGAGSAGALGDFVPLYFDEDTFSIRSTLGKKVLLNNKYYYSEEEIYVNYNKSFSGAWYINLDTQQPSGEITPANHTDYIVMSQVAPFTTLVNPFHVTIGQYYVDGSLNVDKDTHEGYSIREHTTWINGIPNIRKRSEVRYSSGNGYVFYHQSEEVPDIVNFKYWDESESKFFNLYSSDIEQYRTHEVVVYNVPDDISHPFITWDTGDYFEIEVLRYAYSVEGGFASPKTDYSTDWYSITPPSIIGHTLFVRPQNISLEFLDLSGSEGIYYIIDGLQYVDKNTGGINKDVVTFDWTSFSLIPIVLGPTLKMRIHFNVSKISAGAFEATKFERGVVSITGDSNHVVSPDIILKETDTNFASMLNSMGGHISVLITESITVTSEQEITVGGIKIDMLPGTYIMSSTSGLSSIVKFSGEDYEVENLRIISKEDITSGLKLNADGIIKNVLVKQDAVGTTLDNAVEVTSGNIVVAFGRSKVINGTITNKIYDVDGNSEITIA